MKVLEFLSAGNLTVTCGMVTLDRDPEAMRQLFALRTRIWCNKYGEGSTNGIEVDKLDHDDRTIYLALVCEDGTVIGGCRLVFDTFGEGTVEVSRLCQDSAKIGDPSVCDELCRQFITTIDEFIGQVLLMSQVWVTVRRNLLLRIRRYGWHVVETGLVDSHGSKEFPHACIQVRSFAQERHLGRDDVPTFTPGPFGPSWQMPAHV